MDVRNLIGKRPDMARLGKVLDESGHEARVWSVHQWTPRDMAVVWEAAKGVRPITLDDYVPPGTDPLVEVIHHGKNSLHAFKFFQKRFCRPKDPESRDMLIGYNEQAWMGVVGPGYFVAHPASDAGEVDIDYTMLPKEKPGGWPGIEPNSTRGWFVYKGTIDVMHGISSHVTIGRARRKAGWMDAWFVLVRQDPPQPSS